MAIAGSTRAGTTTAAGWLQIGLSVAWGLFGVMLAVAGLALMGAFGQTASEIRSAVDSGGAGVLLLPLLLGFGTFGWIIGLAAVLVVLLGVMLTGWAVFMLLLGVGVLRRSKAAATATLVFTVLFTLAALGAVFGEADTPDDWPEFAELEQSEASFSVTDPFSGQQITVVEPDPVPQPQPVASGTTRGKGMAVLWLLAQLALLVLLVHPQTRKDLAAVQRARQDARLEGGAAVPSAPPPDPGSRVQAAEEAEPH